MRYFSILMLTLISLGSLATAQSVQDAFDELDREAAEFKESKQAEFKLFALKELGKLKTQLVGAGKDSVKVAKYVAELSAFVDSAITDSRADAMVKRAQLEDFLRSVRKDLGLVEKPKVSSSTTGMPVRVLATPAVGLATARKEANWAKNVKSVQEDWYKLAGTKWASKDGKVTFAVGKGKARSASLARNGAESAARRLLTSDGKPGVTVANISGASMVRWDPRDDGYYGLMAIPTAMLPQHVK